VPVALSGVRARWRFWCWQCLFCVAHCGDLIAVHAVCLISSTKRHFIVETVTPNITMACWTRHRPTVVIKAYQSAVEGRARGTERCRARVLLNECGSWYGGFRFAVRGSKQPCMLLDRRLLAFSAWRYARAVFAVVLCPSVSLSVTSRYCVETAGRIELIFVTKASFHLSHTFSKEIWVSPEIKVLPSGRGGSVAEWLACWTQAQ